MKYTAIISLICGIVGTIVNAIIFWQKNREKLLLFKLFADIVWTIHYGLIFAWTGAITCGISIIRETVFLNKKHKWAQSNLWLIFFCAFSLSYGIAAWENTLNILPICGAILSVVSFSVGKPTLSRILQIIISIMFLIYDIYVISYAGIINEICTLTSVMLALIFFNKNQLLLKARIKKN